MQRDWGLELKFGDKHLIIWGEFRGKKHCVRKESSLSAHCFAVEKCRTTAAPCGVDANLVDRFPSPADGVHLPAHLPLLLISQDQIERPGVRRAVSVTSDLQKVQTCHHESGTRPETQMQTGGTHLRDRGFIAPLDEQLWGTDRQAS